MGFYPPDGDSLAALWALEQLEAEGTHDSCLAAARTAVEVLTPGAHGLAPLDAAFTVALTAPPPPHMIERGMTYSGFGARQGFVVVTIWPTPYSIPRLPGAAAHEINHNVRFLFEPWIPQTTVGQYIVAEGLGEAFAVEICGEGALDPWSTAVQGEEVARAWRAIGDAIDVTGFIEISGYIFGDWAADQFGYKPQGLPDFSGYTVGYQLVRAYLGRTGRSAAEATYVPWQEIVREACYF